MIKKVVLPLYLFMFFYCLTSAQGKDEIYLKTILTKSIDSILKKEVDENQIPGAVVLIKKGNYLIYKSAYGYAQKYDFNNRLLEETEKMTTEHLFDIASLTKVVGTTTAMMVLHDQGMFKIDDPVGKYINAFDAPDKQKITIRHLLAHTSGLNEWYPMYYRASNKQEVYNLIGELPLKYPAGEERHYSDLGFTILGQLIETLSGKPLELYLKEAVLLPLAMNNTLFNPNETRQYTKIAATSHGNPYEKRMVSDPSLGFVFKEIDPNQWKGWRNYTLRGQVNDGNAWYANGGISGAAGLFSTAEDLQKLIDMLLNMGKIGNRQFISEKTINVFLSVDTFKNGLGWMMDPDNSFMKNGPAGTFGHTGYTGTSISVIPEEGISVILLINRQNTGLLPGGNYYNVNPIRQQIFQMVLSNLVSQKPVKNIDR